MKAQDNQPDYVNRQPISRICIQCRTPVEHLEDAWMHGRLMPLHKGGCRDPYDLASDELIRRSRK